MPAMNIGSLLNFGKKETYILGVDIGNRAMKIVGMRLGQAPSILFYSIINLSATPAADDAHIAEIIKKCVKENNFASQNAVLTFSDESMAVRRVELPHMPLGEVIEALRWKAKEVVHFDITNAAIGFELLNEVQKEDGSKSMDIIFAAVTNGAIEKRVKIVKDAGLSVIAISVEPFGLGSVLKTGEKTEAPRTTLVIDAGYSKTEISIFKNASLEFVRSIPFGSGALSEVLQAKMMTEKGEEVVFGAEEAEGLKRNMGIAYEAITLENGVTSRQALSLMRPVLERLSKEIKCSIEYYVHEFGQDNITDVFLAGGGGRLKNLDRYLGEELGVPVARMGIPASIDASKVNLTGEDAMSIAAIVGMTTSYRKCLNLLPHEYRAEKFELIEKMSLRTVAAILIGVLWLSFFFTKIKIDDYERRIKNAPFQQDLVAPVKDLRERVVEREAFLSTIQAGEIPIERIMKEISNIIPTGVVLDNLAIRKKEKLLTMKGVFYGSSSAGQPVLARFMEEIKRSVYFKEAQLVSLEGSKAQDKDMASFDIVCSLE